MANTYAQVANDLAAHLNSAGGDFHRMVWDIFYQINDVKKITTARWEGVVEAALEEGVVLGWGQEAVVLAEDLPPR